MEYPAIRCPFCEHLVPLSAGIGSVGAKRWTCRRCRFEFGADLVDRQTVDDQRD